MVFLKWNCRVNWFWNVQIPRKKMVRARTGTIPIFPCCQWDRVMEKHGLVLFYLLHFGLQKNFLREKNLVWTLFWKACLFLNICWKSWNVCEKSKKKEKENLDVFWKMCLLQYLGKCVLVVFFALRYMLVLKKPYEHGVAQVCFFCFSQLIGEWFEINRLKKYFETMIDHYYEYYY